MERGVCKLTFLSSSLIVLSSEMMESGNDSTRKEDQRKRLKKQSSRQSSLDCLHYPKSENEKGKPSEKEKGEKISSTKGEGVDEESSEGDKFSSSKPKNRKRQRLRGKEEDEESESVGSETSDRGSVGSDPLSEGCSELDENKGKSRKKHKGSQVEEEGKVGFRENDDVGSELVKDSKSQPNPFTKKKSSISLDNLSVMDQIGSSVSPLPFSLDPTFL